MPIEKYQFQNQLETVFVIMHNHKHVTNNILNTEAWPSKVQKDKEKKIS